MPKAYSYIRFSTPEQAKGDSLRRQLQAAEAWCAKRGVELDDSIQDLGVSAYRGANRASGALAEFLKLVKSGRIERGSFLLVESLDRLSREAAIDGLKFLIELTDAGIVVVSLVDGQEYSSSGLRSEWTQLILSLATMARSHDESSVKSVRVSEAWAKKRDAARAGRKPMTARCPEWLDLRGGRYVPNARVRVVRQIFRWTIEGYGRRQIVRMLNAGPEPVPTFRSDENRKRKPVGWHTSSVAKIVRNRAVIGEYQPHTGTHKAGNRAPDGDPIPGYYPAVIDETTFWLAQNAVAGRTEVRGRTGPGVAHLLKGLGKCDRCDGPMHIVNKGKMPKGGVYLECSAARRGALCDNATKWRVDVIERRLLRHLSYIDADAILRGSTPAGEAELVEALRAEHADTEQRMKIRAAMLEASQTVPDADSLRRHAELVAREAELKAKLAKAEEALAAATADPGLKARLADAIDLAGAMEGAEGDERMAIRVRLSDELRKIVHQVRFDPDMGVVAILVARPDIPDDEIPFVYGTTKALPWRLSLDDENFPRGIEPWTGQNDEAEIPPEVALPSLARKVAERKAGGR